MPRPLRTMGIPLAGIVLVLFFIYRGFPYERLADTLAPRASRALGARVQIQEVGPRLSWAGPGIEARGVSAVFDDGRRLALDRVSLRPAWSTAWLRGRAALAVDAEGEAGSAQGTWRSGGWRGQLRDVDLTLLPRDSWPGIQPHGRLDAHIDLEQGEAGPSGEVSFEARNGALRFDNFQTPLRYKSSRGELRLGGESFLEVLDFSVEGPMLSATGKGEVGRAQHFQMAPLRLEFQVSRSGGPLTQALRSAGVRVSRGGSARVSILGTPRAPRLQ